MDDLGHEGVESPSQIVCSPSSLQLPDPVKWPYRPSLGPPNPRIEGSKSPRLATPMVVLQEQKSKQFSSISNANLQMVEHMLETFSLIWQQGEKK